MTVPAAAKPESAVLWFDRIGMGDVAQVGGKNASLGEMVRELAGAGVRVPDGFATTAAAFRGFVEDGGLGASIDAALARHRDGSASLQETGGAIRALFLGARFPDETAEAIRTAYRQLCAHAGHADVAVAVRSSATAEDLPGASFAGQQETFLNVRGERALLDACRRCYASLFTDRAIAYREAKGFGHRDVALSVGVQRMVRSDLAGAGVMFTLDPETGFPNVITISAAWGLGETVVQGMVEPDGYVVFKPLLADRSLTPVIDVRIGEKALKTVYAEGGSRRTRTVATSRRERATRVLDEAEMLELARWAAAVERHYGRPMDLEWAKDGKTGELFIVQARPETVHSAGVSTRFSHYRLSEKGKRLVSGAAVGSAIATGKVCRIGSVKDMDAFRDGAILVAETTDPDWMPIMKRAAGIVTDHGGPTSHAAIVSRELGVPAVVGTGDATEKLRDGRAVTLSCAEGERGTVYEGALAFEREDIDPGLLPETRTRLMVNIANPAVAFEWWRLPAKGVGLARMEFIIGSIIKAHPMALLHPERLGAADRHAIRELTRTHADPAEYFVDRLARGIAMLAAPYYPHPAIVRLSDFKTNEYAHLLGGAAFEPDEENPMLGFRGASRYYDPRYREGFALECRALRRVRETLGFGNVVVMVPFCRTPAEADRVLAVMAEEGLKRGEAGLRVYMMCEIPANVVLAEEFAARFDGFSIGSNDLTQLILGVDRDSEILAELFDERDDAVTRTVADVIVRAHRANIEIGICGQAPSNYPDFAAFLVEQGIDSISLNPDSFVATIATVARAESELARTARPPELAVPAALTSHPRRKLSVK